MMKYSTPRQQILILFYFLQILTDLVAVNIALGKYGKDCSGNSLPDILFDGDKDVSATVSKVCHVTTFVEVFLQGQYIVNYVIIYEGKEPSQGNLNFFIVERADKGTYEKCAEYSGITRIYSNDGLRVNCHPSIQLFSVIKIETRKNNGIVVAEIEVHTFGTGVADERAFINRGCFRKFSGLTIATSQPFLLSCQHLCASNGLLLFGIKNNEVCVCGSDYNEDLELTSAYCGVLCDDGKNLCGGEDAFTVYLSMPWLPNYAGCFQTVKSDITSKINVRTIPDCIQYCDAYNYALIEDGVICKCMNETATNTPKYTNCRIKCSGDESTICGGKGYASVYRTCLKDSYPSIRCSKLLRCRNQFDMHGSCHGACQEGFLGEHCLERDKILAKKMTCEAVNPCLKIQNSNCVNKNGEGVCECKAGFLMNDEINACEAPTTTTTTKTTTRITTTATLRITDEATTATTKEATHLTSTLTTAVLCRDKCIDVPHTKCVVLGGQEMCECEEGYSRRNSTDDCEVIRKDPGLVGVSHNKTFTTGFIRGICNTSNHCKDHPNTDCVMINGNEICECSLGYARFKNSEPCQDIDECTENPCNSESTTCINMNGSYYCECKPGHTRVTNEICLANRTGFADWFFGELQIKKYATMWVYIILPLLSVVILALICWFHIPPLSSDSTSESDPTQSELYLYNREQKAAKRKSINVNLKPKITTPTPQLLGTIQPNYTEKMKKTKNTQKK